MKITNSREIMTEFHPTTLLHQLLLVKALTIPPNPVPLISAGRKSLSQVSMRNLQKL